MEKKAQFEGHQRSRPTQASGSEEPEDPVERLLAKTGCLQKHYDVQTCIADYADWRKCQQQVEDFRVCIEEYKKKNPRPEQ